MTTSAIGAGASLMTVDLTKRGLPLRLEVPSCAKLGEPLIKLADRQRDVLLTCPRSAEQPEVFSIQVGPAKSKLDRQAIASAPTFKKWVTDTSDLLQWENTTTQNFVLRSTIADVEYACFPQYATKDSSLLAAELAACSALRLSR